MSINLKSETISNYKKKNLKQETAIKSIQKYGVGSCGPRGFYGTIGKFNSMFFSQTTHLKSLCSYLKTFIWS